MILMLLMIITKINEKKLAEIPRRLMITIKILIQKIKEVVILVYLTTMWNT